MDLISRMFSQGVVSINAAGLDEKLKGNGKPFILDVRQPEEFREGHIQGAKLIPLGDLKAGLDGLPKEREIVCVCASGSRSSSAARMLAAQGFQVTNLQGGMFAWQRANLPVKKGMGS